MSVTSRVRAASADERVRWLAMVAAIAIGLAASALHWSGVVLGGVLCGAVAANRRRALLAGLGFGVLVWVAFALVLVASGDFGAYLTMGRLTAVSAVIPVATATLGALSRWLV
jgi:predicted membrane-bound dolichyl-phosphate-mannose-protein mannosyltransferase